MKSALGGGGGGRGGRGGGGGREPVLMVADGRQMESGDIVAAYAGGMVREGEKEGVRESEGGTSGGGWEDG